MERARRDGQVRLFWPLDDEATVDHPSRSTCSRRSTPCRQRPKDWVDIGDLLRAGKVDEDEAVRWIGEIVGAGDQRIAHVNAVAEQARPPAAVPPVAAVLFGRRKARLGD